MGNGLFRRARPRVSPGQTAPMSTETSSPEQTAPVKHTETSVWRELFDKLDEDGDGVLNLKELEAAAKGESQLMPSRSHTLGKLMAEVKDGTRRGIGPEEFADVMKELFLLGYTLFFQSANIEHQLTTAAWKHVVGDGACKALLREECLHFRCFHSFKHKPREERVAIFHALLSSAVGELAERMADDVVAAGEYAAEQQQSHSKFTDMELGDPLCFDFGIEMLGAMDLDFRNGITREHASTSKFRAWNNNMQRETSPAEQFQMVLPDGWGGAINNKDYHGCVMCSDFEEHPMSRAAGLLKEELVMLRLYTGPCYVLYNGKLRSLLKALKSHLKGDMTTASVREALLAARSQLGADYVTSILVLVSALLKLRTVSQLPPNRKVYRGLAGLSVPVCFLGEDARGNRGGVEFGFLSTSSRKEQALGYVDFSKGMPQLYEITVGQIDRCADLQWVSFFPSEAEMLLPPLCSLEVIGAPKFEDVEVDVVEGGRSVRRMRKVMLWSIRLNVNLKGKTVDEHRAIRSSLHAQMADVALREVGVLVSKAGAPGSPAHDALGETVRAQCAATVREYRQQPDVAFIDNTFYSVAIQDVLMLVPWAAALFSLADDYHVLTSELSQLELKLHLPSVDRMRGHGSSPALSAAAMAVCRFRGVVGGDLEGQNAQGCTALIECADEGKREAVSLLLLCGARIEAQDKEGRTALVAASAHQGPAYAASARMLIDNGANVNVVDSKGRSPLILACSVGFEPTARLLVDKDADVNVADHQGCTALLKACTTGLEDTARLLIEKSAAVNAVEKESGHTPLMTACKLGRVGLARLLVRHRADVDAKSRQADTPLMLACKGGHEETAQLLVELDADFRTENFNSEFALGIACYNGLEGTARLLIAKSADVNVFGSKGGNTPLMLACRKGHDSTANLLIASGAHVNHLNEKGDSPLMLACCAGLDSTSSLLIENGAQVDLEDFQGNTPLLKACEKGLASTACLLIAKGGEVDQSTRGGDTLVMLACQHGMERVASLLVEGGADPNGKNKYGHTALIHACEKRMETTARLLIERRAEVNTPSIDRYGLGACYTPLLLACEKGLEDTARLLVENDARVDTQLKDGSTPLMLACKQRLEPIVHLLLDTGAEADGQSLRAACEKGCDAIARVLLENGADIDDTDQSGYTALMRACVEGHEGTARMLVEEGADVDVKNKSGDTALTKACEKRRGSIACFLVEQDADVNATNIEGITALMFACEEGLETTARLLVDKGADVNAKSKYGNTAFVNACKKRHEATARMLVSKLEDIDAKDLGQDEDTLLILACREGLGAIAQALVEHGADTNATNRRGETALMIACEEGLETTARLLIDNGADADAKSEYGDTALMFACEEGLETTARLLVDKGADVNAKSKYGDTAFVNACKKRHDATACMLVSKLEDIDAKDLGQDEDTLLILACREGLGATAQALVEKGADAKVESRSGETALMHASRNCLTKVVELLNLKGFL